MPILDAKPRDADHVIEVGRDERCIERERVRRNGGIKVLNPRSTAFQGRFDAAEHPADDISPLGAWEFRGDEIEARLQRRPALRPRQPFDAERDLRKHRLRYGDVRRRGRGQPFDDGRAAFHERRKGIGVQDVDHRSRGSFERRACVTAMSKLEEPCVSAVYLQTRGEVAERLKAAVC